ncbi:MAG: radical SAM protein [Bacteroidales bacterium]|nr:radical SAM protein [Bacteroidales bacterium]
MSLLPEISSDWNSPLRECRICPRNCGVDRLSGVLGFCGADGGFNVSSICIHKGEEPPVSGTLGICNVFFSRCNLVCKYCQNWQISCHRGEVEEKTMSLSEVLEKIIAILDQGCKSVGFVSPSHYIPHVKVIIDALRNAGYNPVFIYNTNGYDHVSEIRDLEGYIDVYLPDFKYAENELAWKFSRVRNYKEVALAAIKEMYRQKGSSLRVDDTGQAENGLIIRHLILPGHIENSEKVLQLIAEEISFMVPLSLMAQYWPTPSVKGLPDLGRTLTSVEYEAVIEKMESLGFYKGWIQDLESNEHYRPDFNNRHPFE